MDIASESDHGATEASKRAFWFGHIKSWESSQLRQEVYCKQSGINYNSFVYWRGLFLGELAIQKNKNPKKFIPIKLMTPAPQVDLPRAIQIKLSSGHHVYLPLSMKLDEIAVLLKALGESHA